MHNALSNAKCIETNALCILIFQDFSIFYCFSRFWTNKFAVFSLFYCKLAKISSEMLSKHMTSGKNRDDVLWQMLKNSRNKSLNSQLSNTSPKDYPRTTVQEPHFLQKFLCKCFLLRFFLQKFLCKYFLRRFVSRSFSANVFFSDCFSRSFSANVFCADFFSRSFSADILFE